jgi:SagB-type dehydrogenase family enzyme
LYVKEGGVESLPSGTYYYHPIDHGLVLLSPGARIDRALYGPFINRPIFDEAAFSIYLIAQLGAIAPIYKKHCIHFATLEAGYMSQLLMVSSSVHKIGLCPIGSMEFKQIHRLFELDESQVLVHSLLGGKIDERLAAGYLAVSSDAHSVLDILDERDEGEI